METPGQADPAFPEITTLGTPGMECCHQPRRDLLPSDTRQVPAEGSSKTVVCVAQAKPLTCRTCSSSQAVQEAPGVGAGGIPQGTRPPRQHRTSPSHAIDPMWHSTPTPVGENIPAVRSQPAEAGTGCGAGGSLPGPLLSCSGFPALLTAGVCGHRVGTPWPGGLSL